MVSVISHLMWSHFEGTNYSRLINNVNVITFGQAQSDHTKQFLLYFPLECFICITFNWTDLLFKPTKWIFFAQVSKVLTNTMRFHIMRLGKWHMAWLDRENILSFPLSGVNFTNMFMCNFYVCRSQKLKKTVKLSVSFCAFGICEHKSCLKNVGEINFRSLITHKTKTKTRKQILEKQRSQFLQTSHYSTCLRTYDLLFEVWL